MSKLSTLFSISGLALTTFALTAPSVARAEPAATMDTSYAHDPALLGNIVRGLVARPGGLTAAAVARRTAENSPAVSGALAKRQGALAEAERARQGFYPKLTLIGRYTRLSPIEQSALGPSEGSLVGTPLGAGPLPANAPLVGVAGFSFPVVLNQFLFQANLNVPLSDYFWRIKKTVLAAEAGAQQALLNQALARRNAAFSGRVAFYLWARAELEHVIAEQALAREGEHLRVARVSLDAGKLLLAEVLRAESERGAALLLVEQAKSNVSLTRAELQLLMHDAESATYSIGDDLLAPAAAKAWPSLAELKGEASKRRLELKALAESERALAAKEAALSAQKYPRLDAFGNAYYANPHPRVVPAEEAWKPSWDVGVQVTWVPNEIGLTRASEKGVAAERGALRADARSVHNAVEREVTQAYYQLSETRLRVSVGWQNLRAAQAAYDARRALLEAGKSTLADVLDAETLLVSSQLQLINAMIDVRVTEARLEHVLGRDAS